MAPTPLTVTSRYTPPGNRKVYWITTAAAYTAPTRAEMNAGIDITNEIATFTGFQLTSADAPTPDLSTGFVGSVPARQTASASEIIFYASLTSNDARTVFPRGTTGYVILLPEGDVPGQKMEVWPVKVNTMSIDPSIENPGQVHVGLSITKIPAQNVTIPA